MDEVQRVLVVGGGIGGMSASIALRREGVEVDVIERNPKWDVYGVGIIQPGNALRALGALGLAGDALAAGHPMIGDRAYLQDGVTLLADQEWPNPDPSIPAGNGITRKALHEIFQRHALASGTEVRPGVVYTSMVDDGEGVDVAFSDGSSGRYDLVIGADGIASQVRETIFPGQYSPHYTGQICWRYNFPIIEGLDKIWVFMGPTGTVGFVPIGPELMYMFCIEVPPPEIDPYAIAVEGSAALLRSRIADFGGIVAEQRELIRDDSGVVVRPVENVMVAPPWNVGRVVLLGDALHATSPHCGQGAAQAMEDAVVLAEELAADRPLQESLAAYTARRYDRCRMIVEGSEAIGAWEQDHSIDLDPQETRVKVTMAAMAPF